MYRDPIGSDDHAYILCISFFSQILKIGYRALSPTLSISAGIIKFNTNLDFLLYPTEKPVFEKCF